MGTAARKARKAAAWPHPRWWECRPIGYTVKAEGVGFAAYLEREGYGAGLFAPIAEGCNLARVERQAERVASREQRAFDRERAHATRFPPRLVEVG